MDLLFIKYNFRNKDLLNGIFLLMTLKIDIELF